MQVRVFVKIHGLRVHVLALSSITQSFSCLVTKMEVPSLKRSADEVHDEPIAKKPRVEEEEKKPEWVLIQIRGEDEDMIAHYLFDRTSTPDAQDILDAIKEALDDDTGVNACATFIERLANPTSNARIADKRLCEMVLKCARGSWKEIGNEETLLGVDCVQFIGFVYDY
jgi:hypothetical protein